MLASRGNPLLPNSFLNTLPAESGTLQISSNLQQGNTVRLTHLRRRPSIRALLALSAAIVAAQPQNPALAAEFIFNGASSSSWSDPANWNNATIPVEAFDTYITVNGGANPINSDNDLSNPFTLNGLRVGGTLPDMQFITGQPIEFIDGPFEPLLNMPLPGNITRVFNSTSPFTIENDLLFNRDLILSGSTIPITLNGVMQGAGRLTPFNGTYIITNSGNSYTGGTVMTGGVLSVIGSGTLGSGPVSVASARLVLDSAANIISGNGSVDLGQGGYVQFNSLDQAAIDLISHTSVGAIALPGDFSGPTLDLRLHGALRIGTALPGETATVTLWADILPANQTYRFGGQDPASINSQTADTLRIASLLTDGQMPHVVDIAGSSSTGVRAGKIQIVNTSNSYAGGTIVGPGAPGNSMSALSIDFATLPGETPLGTGPIIVHGTLMFEGHQGRLGDLPNDIQLKPGSVLMFNNVIGDNPWSTANNVNRWPDNRAIELDSSSTLFYTKNSGVDARETVGEITYNGASELIIDAAGFGPGVTSFKIGGLTRGLEGTLTLVGRHFNTFNHSPTPASVERFEIVDTSIVDPVTLMVHPSVVGIDRSANVGEVGWFLRPVAGPGGLALEYYPPVAFDDTTENEVAHFGGAPMSPVDQVVHALRILPGFTLPIPAGRTLTVKSGGIIGGSIGGAGTLVFDNHGFLVEAFFFINDEPATVSVPIVGQGGLTKFGGQALTLAADNDLQGLISINNGDLRIGHANAIDPNNPVHIYRNGDLDLNGFDLTLQVLKGAGSVTNLGGTLNTLTLQTDVDSEFAGRLSGGDRGRHTALTKRGAGNLTLSGIHAYAGPTRVEEGTLTFTGSRLIFITAPGQPQITYFGDFITSPGTELVFASTYTINNLDGQGTTRVTMGGNLTATHIREDALILEDGAVAQIVVNGTSDATSRIGLLQMARKARLDLCDNDLVLDSADFAQVIDLVNADQITSSLASDITGLAVVANDRGDGTPIMTTFSGQSVDASDVLLMYTYLGDASLDGRVTIRDFLTLDRAFARQPANPTWRDGDFDGSGTIDARDFFTTDNSYLLQGAPLGAASDPVAIPPGGAPNSPASSAAVPEPSALALFTLLGLIPGRRRRRCGGAA